MGNKAGHRSAPAGGVGPRVTVCVVFIIKQCTVTPEESVTYNIDKVDMSVCICLLCI